MELKKNEEGHRIVTREYLKVAFTRLRICAGMKVMGHSARKSLGHVEGGADTANYAPLMAEIARCLREGWNRSPACRKCSVHPRVNKWTVKDEE